MSTEARELLRQHGLQVTAQRLAVLGAVDSVDHGTADDIAQAVRDQIGSVSRQTIYDALNALADKGIIRRIQPAGSPTRFENRVGDNHHHLICRACDAVVDVDCVVGAAPCLDPSHAAGYVIDEAEVLFWGLCPKCQAKG